MQEKKLKSRDAGGYQNKSVIIDQKKKHQTKPKPKTGPDLFVCDKGKKEVTSSEIEITCQGKLQIDEGEKRRSVIYL